MGASPDEPSTDQRLLLLVAAGTVDLQAVVSISGEYQFVSAAGAAPFGWTPADLLGRPQASFTHPDDEALVIEAHRRLLAEGSGSATTVQRFRCKDGTFRWTESRSRVAETAGDRVVVASVRDIAERRTAELDLQRQAATDPLTGVANAERCSWTASARAATSRPPQRSRRCPVPPQLLAAFPGERQAQEAILAVPLQREIEAGVATGGLHSADPAGDAWIIHDFAFAALRRYLADETTPTPAQTQRLVDFARRALASRG